MRRVQVPGVRRWRQGYQVRWRVNGEQHSRAFDTYDDAVEYRLRVVEEAWLGLEQRLGVVKALAVRDGPSDQWRQTKAVLQRRRRQHEAHRFWPTGGRSRPTSCDGAGSMPPVARGHWTACRSLATSNSTSASRGPSLGHHHSRSLPASVQRTARTRSSSRCGSGGTRASPLRPRPRRLRRRTRRSGRGGPPRDVTRPRCRAVRRLRRDATSARALQAGGRAASEGRRRLARPWSTSPCRVRA
jgi:hypothetical protein